ncbi:hypothetical protein C8R46DRAFT_1083184 [Mycena filopes]|nr:hypothetical protein C8R46DRAFT_1083184 [Mycena filopes]
MSTSYSAFYESGLHGHASSVYTHTHPRDDDMDHTADQVYFAAAAPYHITSSRARSPPRKRRSSITSGASPVSAMKLRSPARAAGNAWHIAHIAAVAASPGRSRSSSLNVASEDTSMFGRMRSGSVGARLRTRKPLTNRRPVALLSAPTPPPPSAPLPALPLCAPARPPLSRLAIQVPPLPPADAGLYKGSNPASPVPSSPSTESYHPPGAWMAFGTIDEEMKEN